jgi:hypothetical protein
MATTALLQLQPHAIPLQAVSKATSNALRPEAFRAFSLSEIHLLLNRIHALAAHARGKPFAIAQS